MFLKILRFSEEVSCLPAIGFNAYRPHLLNKVMLYAS